MKLINYSRNRLFGTLDELLNLSIQNLSPVSSTSAPAAYHHEDEDSHHLHLDLPGFTRDEITVTLQKNTLTISAKSLQETPFNREVEQSYILPKNIDPESITAKLEHGVLNLSLKKLKEEQNTPRKIDILAN